MASVSQSGTARRAALRLVAAAAGRLKAPARPETGVRRVEIPAGGGLGWTLSALESAREQPAPWRIVVVTGAPSWTEAWAPVIAALPHDREMIVVERPGYGASGPSGCVPEIGLQALALAPLITPRPGQRLLLVGQSYGAAIAARMAEAFGRDLGGLVLLSSFLGAPGPTARALLAIGARARHVMPRDLRNAVAEVSGQAAQIGDLAEILADLSAPVHVLHGDADDYAPAEPAARLAAAAAPKGRVRFELMSGVDHFVTDDPPHVILSRLETCIALAPAREPEAACAAAPARRQRVYSFVTSRARTFAAFGGSLMNALSRPSLALQFGQRTQSGSPGAGCG